MDVNQGPRRQVVAPVAAGRRAKGGGVPHEPPQRAQECKIVRVLHEAPRQRRREGETRGKRNRWKKDATREVAFARGRVRVKLRGTGEYFLGA